MSKVQSERYISSTCSQKIRAYAAQHIAGDARLIVCPVAAYFSYVSSLGLSSNKPDACGDAR